MPPLKIGIIGCGRIVERVHLNLLTQLPKLDLIALAEPDPQRRAAAAQRVPTATATSSYQELLALPAVEAVVISLPPALHAEATIAALQHGKHVYLEKPLATQCSDGQRMLAAWQATDLVGMIGFNYRFNALYRAARRSLRAERIGRVVGVRAVFSTAARTLPAWKQARGSGGGALLDLATHHIDLLHFLLEQPIADVYAEIQSHQTDADTVSLLAHMADGTPVQALYAMNMVDEDRVEIYGQRGKLTIDRLRGWNATVTPPTLPQSRIKQIGQKLLNVVRSPYLRERLFAPGSEPSYAAAFSHFVAAVHNRTMEYPDLWDGYRSLAVVAAAEESAQAGHTVQVQDIRDEDFAGQRLWHANGRR